MKSQTYAELQAMLRRYRFPSSNISDGMLRKLLQLADEVGNLGDHGIRAEVIKLLSLAREFQEDWAKLPLHWTLEAASRRSPWTSEMVMHIVKGWPFSMVKTPFLDITQTHPGAVADALLTLLQNSHIIPQEIPNLLVETLMQSAPGAGGNAITRVARLISIIRAKDVQWGERVASWLYLNSLRDARLEIMEALMEGWPNLFPPLESPSALEAKPQ